jgi:hypothetical protein
MSAVWSRDTIGATVSDGRSPARYSPAPRHPPPVRRLPPSPRCASPALLDLSPHHRSTSYLGAYLRRQRARLGSPKAVTATAHKLARIVYHLMRYGMGYVKQTEAAYAEEVRERLEKQLRRRAKELGFEVKKVEPTTVPTTS